MAAITAADVKKLRDLTSAGMMECKKALTEADGDFDAAVEILRISGAAKAAKRGAERDHQERPGRLAGGSLVELLCETDFVAKNADFQAFADEIVALADEIGAERPRRPSPAPRWPTARPSPRRSRRLSGVIGEKLELGRVALLEGTIATYMHKRAADLPPQVGVLVAYEGNEAHRARHRHADRRDAPRVPHPRRGPGRRRGQRAAHRRGDRA